MEVVDVQDAFDGLHAGADVIELDAAGGSLEEDVEGFADDVDAGPQDERGDDEGENGVDPAVAGVEDCSATYDDRGGGEGVAGHVEECAAHVHVTGDSPEEGGDDAIHYDAGCGYTHHQPRLNGDGGAEAVDGFDGDPNGNEDQGCGVDEGSEDTGALIAEGLGAVGGAGLEVDGDEAEEEREEVGGVVAGFGEEREGVSAESEDEGDHHVRKGGDKGEAEYGLCPRSAGRGRGVDMHDVSLDERQANERRREQGDRREAGGTYPRSVLSLPRSGRLGAG